MYMSVHIFNTHYVHFVPDFTGTYFQLGGLKQLGVKLLAQGLNTWRGSNPRPCGHETDALPMSHHVPMDTVWHNLAIMYVCSWYMLTLVMLYLILNYRNIFIHCQRKSYLFYTRLLYSSYLPCISNVLTLASWEPRYIFTHAWCAVITLHMQHVCRIRVVYISVPIYSRMRINELIQVIIIECLYYL
jgi:hypothetical protein